jgi:hypothetical protein
MPHHFAAPIFSFQNFKALHCFPLVKLALWVKVMGGTYIPTTQKSATGTFDDSTVPPQRAKRTQRAFLSQRCVGDLWCVRRWLHMRQIYRPFASFEALNSVTLVEFLNAVVIDLQD